MKLFSIGLPEMIFFGFIGAVILVGAVIVVLLVLTKKR